MGMGRSIPPSARPVTSRILFFQSARPAGEMVDWGNYCHERSTDRWWGAAVETLTTIIAINSSTSILQGAI
jgi:hypothetical protein